MKSYTSLRQSNKLAKILPLESADMWYHGHYSPWESERIYDEEPCLFHSKWPNWDNPCWSLAALLSVIRETIGYTIYGINNVYMSCDLGDKPWKLETEVYDNEIDACVDMIEKLHGLNLL